MINSFFDKIVCINLKERIDRWKECEKEFEKININVERVDAIKPEFGNEKLNNGELGLIETNIKIFEEAINNNLSNILIFEDDIFFIENFNEYFKKINFLPEDWDFIHLGGNNHFNKGNFVCVSNEESTKYLNFRDYKKINYELCTTAWSQTTHAVGFNKKIFKDILISLYKKEKPLDMIYCDLQQSNLYKTYAFIPSLCLQRASYSNILNRNVDYNNNLHFF